MSAAAPMSRRATRPIARHAEPRRGAWCAVARWSCCCSACCPCRRGWRSRRLSAPSSRRLRQGRSGPPRRCSMPKAASCARCKVRDGQRVRAGRAAAGAGRRVGRRRPEPARPTACNAERASLARLEAEQVLARDHRLSGRADRGRQRPIRAWPSRSPRSARCSTRGATRWSGRSRCCARSARRSCRRRRAARADRAGRANRWSTRRPSSRPTAAC